MIASAAIAALLSSEAIGFYLAAELIAAGYHGKSTHAVAGWMFVAIALVAFGLPRLIEGYGLSPRKMQAIVAAAGMLLIYAVVRYSVAGDLALWQLGWVGEFVRGDTDPSVGGRAFFAAALTIALWVRTSIRFRDEVEVESISRQVALPFVLVTGLMVLGAATNRAPEVARAGAAFYALAIIALALSQLSLSGATIGHIRSGGVTAALLAATAVFVVAGLLLAGLVFGLLGPLLGPAFGRAVTNVLTIVLTPFSWALSNLFKLLFRGGAGLPNLNPAAVPNQKPTSPNAGYSPAHRYAVDALRGAALLIIIAVAAGGVWLVIRLRNRVRDLHREDHAVASAGSFGDDVRDLLGSLFRRGAGRNAGQPSEMTKLYLDVLRRAEQTGQPRAPGETPTEIAPRLTTAFRAAVTDDITRAFEEARYAGREPDPRTLAELQERWSGVR